MAKTKIEVDLVIKGGDSVEQVESKTKSLKAQLKEMKALLASGTLDNQAFNKLSKEAGALQDKIGDVNTQVKNLASDSQKLDGIISLTQGIVGGFAAVEGITALVGDSNEDLQKTMVKLQGAMSALAGIQAVANTLNKTSAAYTTANTIATNISTFAQQRYAAAVGTSTGVMKVFRLVGATLGIGLIVAAIGLLVSNFDKLKATVSKFLPSLDSIVKGFKLAYNAVTDFLGITNDQTRAADKLKESSDKLLVTQKNELDVLKAGNATKKEIYIAEYKLMKDRVDMLDKIAKLNGKYSKNEAEERAQLIQDLKVLNATYEADKSNELAKNNEEARKKRAEENKKRQEEQQKQYLQDLKDREQNAKNERELIDSLEEEDKKASDEADQKKKEDDAFKLAWKLEQYNFEKKKIKEADEKALADQKAIEEARLSIVTDSYNSINNIGELLLGQQYKNSALGKTIALAQIATDTALAISALTKNSEANPANAPTSGIAGAVQFAAGFARITASILKAKSILSGGGSVTAPSGGSGGTNVSSQPPRIDTFQSNQKPNNPNQRVYVLEKDITDSQGRVARIRHNATLI